MQTSKLDKCMAALRDARSKIGPEQFDIADIRPIVAEFFGPDIVAVEYAVGRPTIRAADHDIGDGYISLATEVNKLVAQGFVPHGDAIPEPTDPGFRPVFIQRMVKYGEV